MKDYQVAIRHLCKHVTISHFQHKPQRQELREIKAREANKPCPRCENVVLMKEEK